MLRMTSRTTGVSPLAEQQVPAQERAVTARATRDAAHTETAKPRVAAYGEVCGSCFTT